MTAPAPDITQTPVRDQIMKNGRRTDMMLFKLGMIMCVFMLTIFFSVPFKIGINPLVMVLLLFIVFTFFTVMWYRRYNKIQSERKTLESKLKEEEEKKKLAEMDDFFVFRSS